jgi:small subunit ribosomal protein S6
MILARVNETDATERIAMRQYELTYLVSDKISETDLNKITGKVGGFVSDAAGKVLKEEIWKRRKLAYPIKKQEFATYVTLNFELPVEAVRNLDQEIKLTPQIIRHLLILKEMGEEKLSLLSEEIVGAEEIESVIGGEKTFEAVEGMTEESRKLMATREEEEKETRDKGLEISENKTETEKLQPEVKIKEPAPTIEDVKKETETKKFEAVAEEKPTEIEKPKKTKAETSASKEPIQEKSKKSPTKEEKIKKSIKPDSSSEADRLAKLDEEIDNLLKDDL